MAYNFSYSSFSFFCYAILSAENEIMSYLFFRSSFNDDGFGVSEYDNK